MFSNPFVAQPLDGEPPFFDIPALRRVKPLPQRSKRPRTNEQENAPPTLLTNLGAFPMPPTFPGSPDDDHDADRERDQQGNTKKRKVPAANRNDFRAFNDADANDEPTKLELGGEAGATRSRTGKPNLSPAAAAGIKFRELIKTRKRLIAPVLANGPPRDEFALDLALAAPLNWRMRSSSSDPSRKPSKKSKRKREEPKRPPSVFTLPSGKFTYKCPSASSDRLRAMTADIIEYQSRFITELERLVTHAANAAKKALSLSPDAKLNKPRKKAATAAANLTPTTNANDSSGLVTPTRGTGSVTPELGHGSLNGSNQLGANSKKKKRKSGKASDPHQIRNYIPSRLPTGNGAPQPPTANQVAMNTKNLVSPLPLIFLAAEPVRRRKAKPQPDVTSSIPPVQPTDEWICCHCEFNLFYGDEAALRKAVKARKTLLKRRRRARERAAAAASGQAKPRTSGGSSHRRDDGSEEGSEEDEEDEGFAARRGGGGAVLGAGLGGMGDQEAKFVDPAEVDARIAASMNASASRKPVMKETPDLSTPPALRASDKA